MRYLHIRNHNFDQSFDTKGGITVGYEINSLVEPHQLQMATAYCNPADNYCRRIGRLIVEGRMNKGMYVTIDIPPNVKSIQELILQHLHQY
jgi:hypothetical protein